MKDTKIINYRLFIPIIFALLFGFVTTTFAEQGNTALSKKVEAAIARNYDEDFTITATNNGRVSVKGEVPTLYDKYRIFDIVSAVPGVKEIEDLITINTPVTADDIIKANIDEELKLVHSIEEPDRIKVTVDNGIVFLKGTVSYYREKLEAETVVSWQQGVLGIENDLKVLPPKEAKSDANLKIILNELLKNRFPIDNNVLITVNNGVVTLTGDAFSLRDKRDMEKEFSRVLGVKRVVDKTTLENLEHE